MATRTALRSIRVDIAINGYVVEVDYDTDEPTKEKWDQREYDKHIARDNYELLYGVLSPVLSWHDETRKSVALKEVATEVTTSETLPF